jgi:hypothetical protein
MQTANKDIQKISKIKNENDLLAFLIKTEKRLSPNSLASKYGIDLDIWNKIL